MKRYFIEVPHGESKNDCQQAIDIFQQTGNHFLAHAEWGCLDGEHKAWIIAEVPSREDARNIVPPFYRPRAKIVELSRFSVDTQRLHPE